MGVIIVVIILSKVKYSVDPAYLKPGEGHLFLRHLNEQLLHVDVWDGDSLLLIGSTAVELKVPSRCKGHRVNLII